MEGTDLKPKTKPLYIKIFYWLMLFIVVFVFIFYLYGLLWEKYSGLMARSITVGFYMEKTNVECMTTEDCKEVCKDIMTFDSSNACLCLKRSCVYVENANQFAESKYCEGDSDCTVSCYEGPVNKFYYDSVGGEVMDCSQGCRTFSQGSYDNDLNTAICENNQCRYTSNQTCFIGSMKK